MSDLERRNTRPLSLNELGILRDLEANNVSDMVIPDILTDPENQEGEPSVTGNEWNIELRETEPSLRKKQNKQSGYGNGKITIETDPFGSVVNAYVNGLFGTRTPRNLDTVTTPTAINLPNFQAFELHINGQSVALDGSTGIFRKNNMQEDIRTSNFNLALHETTLGVEVKQFASRHESDLAIKEMKFTPQVDMDIQLSEGINGNRDRVVTEPIDNPSEDEPEFMQYTHSFYKESPVGEREGRIATNYKGEKIGIQYVTETISDCRIAITKRSEIVEFDPETGREIILQPQDAVIGERNVSEVFSFKAKAGKTYTLRTVTSLNSDVDGSILSGLETDPVRPSTQNIAECKSYEQLEEEHKQEVANWWAQSDVIIEGDEQAQEDQRNVRFGIQTAYLGILKNYPWSISGAKALHEEEAGYGGRKFWDGKWIAEAYKNDPEAFAMTIEYLVLSLDAFYAKAAQNGYPGIWIRWEGLPSFEDPEKSEGCPQYNYIKGKRENVHTYDRTIHTNATWGHEILSHYLISGNKSVFERASEILVASLPFYDQRGTVVEVEDEQGHKTQRVEYIDTIGPDEFTPGDNNAYTNMMIRAICLETIKLIKNGEISDKMVEKVFRKVGIDPKDKQQVLENWEEKFKNIYIAMGPDLLIKPCDGWEDLEDVDLTAAEHQGINYNDEIELQRKRKVLKQPDVEQGLQFLAVINAINTTIPADHFAEMMQAKIQQGMSEQEASKAISDEVCLANWNYHSPLNWNGSSLGPSAHIIQSIDAGQNTDLTYPLFKRASKLNIEGTKVEEGLQTAAAGGTVGVARRYTHAIRPDYLEVQDNMPSNWTRSQCGTQYKGQGVEIDIRRIVNVKGEQLSEYTTLLTDPSLDAEISVMVAGELVKLTHDRPRYYSSHVRNQIN